mgnify:CR=1 FL=1
MKDEFQIEKKIVTHFLNEEEVSSNNSTINKWLQAEKNKKDLQKYYRIWKEAGKVNQFQKYNVPKAWSKVDSKLKSRNIQMRRLKNLAYATAGMVASLFIFFSLYYFSIFSTSESTIALSTAYGSHSKVMLPDGSVVKLNAGSSLSYHFDNRHKIRSVDFSGEAFFDVTPSPKPFVIHTPGGLNVKVLGTKFNLIAYTEDHMIQTTLIEGTVELYAPGTTNLILRPGQIAVFDEKINSLKYADKEVTHQLGWMQGKLYMDNMSLEEVCKRLERWYDVDISLSDLSLGEKIHYTGVLKEQNIQDILDALCKLSSITYELKGKEIKIRKK